MEGKVDEQEIFTDLIERGTELLNLPGTALASVDKHSHGKLMSILDCANATFSSVSGGVLLGKPIPERNIDQSMEKAALAVSDAKLISLCCTVAKGQTEGIDGNLDSYNPEMFTDYVISLLEKGLLFERTGYWDWTQLDKAVGSIFRPVPTFCPMLGALPAEDPPPPPVRRARQAAVPAAALQRPANVTTADEAETQREESVEEMVQAMLSLLRQTYRQEKRPVCIFRFLIDPHSFAHSVENMFHLTFLVKDNLVMLNHDERGLPVLTPIEPTEGEQAEGADCSENQQMLISLSPPQWREVVQVLKIKEPMIKRPGSQTPSGISSLESSQTPSGISSLESSQTPSGISSLESSQTPSGISSLESSQTSSGISSQAGPSHAF